MTFRLWRCSNMMMLQRFKEIVTTHAREGKASDNDDDSQSFSILCLGKNLAAKLARLVPTRLRSTSESIFKLVNAFGLGGGPKLRNVMDIADISVFGRNMRFCKIQLIFDENLHK